MAIKQRVQQEESNNQDFELLEAGEYEARLVYVADLGVQEGMTYKGVKKADRQQIALGLEILGKTVTIDGVEKPQIMWTAPFNIFSNLLDLGKELPYYKVFDSTAKEGNQADWDAQLGKPCNVTVVHVSGRGDNSENTYANLDTISPIPAKYAKDVDPAATSDMCTGDADNEDNPAQVAMYGLVRFVYDRRLEEGGSLVDTTPSEDVNPYV